MQNPSLQEWTLFWLVLAIKLRVLKRLANVHIQRTGFVECMEWSMHQNCMLGWAFYYFIECYDFFLVCLKIHDTLDIMTRTIYTESDDLERELFDTCQFVDWSNQSSMCVCVCVCVRALAYWWGGGAWGALAPQMKLNHDLFSIYQQNIERNSSLRMWKCKKCLSSLAPLARIHIHLLNVSVCRLSFIYIAPYHK